MEACWTAFTILTDKPTEKRPLRRPKRGWKGNITMNLKGKSINTRNCVDSC